METEEIRRFNRYYTRILGVFDKNVFDLDYSMLEMRIIGEIGRNIGITANELTKCLNINKSYLSRILSKLEKAGYLKREKDAQDSRIFHLYLNDQGLELNQYVEAQSDQKVIDLLTPLPEKDISELKAAMKKIEEILYQVVTNELEEKNDFI